MNECTVYIGFDPRDELAFRACVASLVEHSSVKLRIIPLREYELRRKNIYWRSYAIESNGQMTDARDGRPFSTQFSFTRFAVPLIDKREGWVLFCDADMLFRRDVAELFALAEGRKDAIMCVQHNYMPPEAIKMDGVQQKVYGRKNWSSLMLMNPSRCRLTPYIINNSTGQFLHQMLWQPDKEIGALPESWNWLEGWSDPDINPDNVHYTRGTPDMLPDSDLPFADEWWRQLRRYQLNMHQHGLDG